MEKPVRRYILETFLDRYHLGGKKEKSSILDEVCREFKFHRKHATRLMKKRKASQKPVVGKRGRKSKYDFPEFLSALHKVRRVMEFRNAEVIKENIAEWLPFIEKHHGVFSDNVRVLLSEISASTMKRYFHRMRKQASRGVSTTRP